MRSSYYYNKVIDLLVFEQGLVEGIEIVSGGWCRIRGHIGTTAEWLEEIVFTCSDGSCVGTQGLEEIIVG